MRRLARRLAVLLVLISMRRAMLPALALPLNFRYRLLPFFLPAGLGSWALWARTQAKPLSTESHGFLQHLHDIFFELFMSHSSLLASLE